MLILRIVYLHTRTHLFLLFLDKVSIYLPFLDYHVRLCLSLYSLSLNLLLYSCPGCREWKREVFTLLNPYTVFRDILILKLGDSINSHIHTKMFEAWCLEAIIDRIDPHIIQFIHACFISRKLVFEKLFLKFLCICLLLKKLVNGK